jgi:hypothetical protein
MTKSAILDSSLSKLKIYAYFVMEKNKVVLQQKSKKNSAVAVGTRVVNLKNFR